MKTKRSKYFIPFKKESTFDGNLGRMIKGAFIHQEAAGIYTWLSLGQRMLEKATKIIDEELEKIDALKICMPILHEAKLWKKSERYDEFGSEMLKIFDRNNHEFVYGPSAEEMITNLVSKWGLNKNSLPFVAYNTQWKFRDEIRPRFGVIRSREFLMKDAYSFHKTSACLEETYKKMFQVYSNIFYKMGLNVCTISSDVGIMGGSMSHEFIIESEFGEEHVKYDNFPSSPIKWEERNNVEIDPNASSSKKFAEIGHIYALEDKYSKTFKLLNPENNQPLLMGCYGIGVSRLIALVFEKHSFDLGALSPFKYTILNINQNENVIEAANKFFQECNEVIWDDRDVSYGIKCAEADLIGSPIQIHIGSKELENNQVIIKRNGKKECYSIEEAMNIIK